MRLIGLISLLQCAIVAGAESVDFARDVRPILSENCFKCHGPDDAAREADIRLDTRAGLFARSSDSPLITSADPSQSLLFRRITADAPDERMPPPDSNLALTPVEIDLIRRWIESGAAWEDHWSLRPLIAPRPPKIADLEWSLNPIDAFVRARLDREGLKPSPPADRAQLLRRVTLDLTGLPPTAEELSQFLSDDSPDAFAKVVDRLLASPAYGERMAWDWLDAARYADTNGYQGDRERTMHPWRDWVVDAFNRNLPFDDFTIQQIAGDLLPDATYEQRLATGFCRNHMINGEGGRIAEENRVDYVMDMSETVGTVWLGLTLNCCRCHDHKFDPVTRRNYYEMFAFFNQTPVTGAGGDPQTPPVLAAYSDEQSQRLAMLDAQQRQLKDRQAARAGLLAEAQTDWERAELQKLEASGWSILHPSHVAAEHQTLEILADGSVLAGGGPADQDVYTVTTPLPAEPIAAIRLEALQHASLTQKGLSRADSGNFVLTSFRMRLIPPSSGSEPTESATPLKLTAARATFEQGGQQVRNTLDDDPRSGWGVWEGKVVDREQAAVFILDRPLNAPAGSTATFELRHDSPHARHNIGRFRLSVVGRADAAPEVGSNAVHESLRIPLAERTPEQQQHIREAHEASDAEFSQLASQLQELDKQRRAVVDAAPKVMVMADQPESRKTFELERGLYNQPGDEVHADVPDCLPGLPAEAPRNRLGLARWLVSDAQPLTARVTVNRFWQQLFGRGLVKTPEDFGAQGAPPDHPELLDWLASDFRTQGWNIKRLMRLMVLSRTYQQSSHASPAAWELDPDNRLLSRGARFRRPAWMIRDQALAAAGLLVRRPGGASVNGYQPAGVWEEATFGNKKYKQDHGEALYRRSLYTFWRRIVGPTMFFDNASRQTCTVKVVRTNTPLQAVLTLNDVTFVEAARALAQSAWQVEGHDDDARLDAVFLRVLTRPASAAERAILLPALARSRDQFSADPAAAAAFLATGESSRDAAIPAAEHAAWTALCLAVLNLDETLNRE